MSGAEVRADTCDYTFCTEGSLCLFGDENYAGRCIGIPENSDGALLFTPDIGGYMNDLTTAIWNRTGREICFFRDINYQAFMFCMPSQAYSSNIGGDFNDAISSFQPKF